jgi:hypothetical protein
MAYVHDPECWQSTRTTCPFCDSLRLASSGRGERIIAAMQTAHDEAVTAGQTAKANAIQLMIDKVSTVM